MYIIVYYMDLNELMATIVTSNDYNVFDLAFLQRALIELWLKFGTGINTIYLSKYI